MFHSIRREIPGFMVNYQSHEKQRNLNFYVQRLLLLKVVLNRFVLAVVPSQLYSVLLKKNMNEKFVAFQISERANDELFIINNFCSVTIRTYTKLQCT